MKRINVESSQIRSVGYDCQSLILEIEFKNNRVYQYRNVTALIICQLIFAESVGSFFMKNIKNNYEFEEIKYLREEIK